MPDHCCIPECRSNYKGTNEYVSVFQFPKDEEIKKLWCRKIPRADFKPGKRAVVCEKHFRDEMIIREEEFPDKEGKILKFIRKKPVLKDDAYPCIFDGCPSYLTENKPKERLGRGEKLANLETELFNRFEEHDKILNFATLKTNIGKELECLLTPDIIIHFTEVELFIFFMRLSEVPKILKTIKFDIDLNVYIYANEVSFDLKNIQHILKMDKLCLWSELVNIVSHVKNIECDKLKENAYEQAVNNWRLLVNAKGEEYNCEQFMLEQMLLCNKSPQAKRCSSDLTAFA